MTFNSQNFDPACETSVLWVKRKKKEVADLYLELRDTGRQFLWLQRHTDLFCVRLFRQGVSRRPAKLQHSVLIYNACLGSRLSQPSKLQAPKGKKQETHRVYMKSPGIYQKFLKKCIIILFIQNFHSVKLWKLQYFLFISLYAQKESINTQKGPTLTYGLKKVFIIIHTLF